MFGSYWTVPGVQFPGSATAFGAAAMGSSPPAVSAWSLERYGQNVTESESGTPVGQLASGTGLPFTGFSGIGGLYVVEDGAVGDDHTAGPGVGSATVPVRRPHQSFCATTGVVELFDWPSSVVLSTPNALSVMLLFAIVDGPAPTSRTPAPRRRFWLLSAWLPSGYGSLFGVGAKTLPTGEFVPFTRFDDTVSPDICRRAPAVTRTPSCPKSGPVVSGSGGGIAGVLRPPAWYSQSPSITVGPPAVGSS